MKLYTEEQVKNFLKERTFIREETIDAMCDTLTPIELPSHRDITVLVKAIQELNQQNQELNDRLTKAGL
jgi:hypothetical protein